MVAPTDGPVLIYCAAGNPRFAAIAVEAGFAYGAQLPGHVSQPNLYMSDQDWKSPNRAAYMQALQAHRPVMASVLDLEREEQLPEVLSWAEEAAQWAQESVMIIPKAFDVIDRIPLVIGGKAVVLGYSVPTRFGGTCVPIWEFAGRPVHLLGGSPHRQMREYHALSGMSPVVSADGNMAQRQALRYCQYWSAVKRDGDNWVALNRETKGADDLYEAFRLSCVNVMQAWKEIDRR